MALLTASALGKTIRENDIDSLYYFYGHDYKKACEQALPC